MSLASWVDAPQVRHVHRFPARAGTTGPWPDWLSAEVRESCRRMGVTALWQHQVEAAEAIRAGRSVVLSTGTASGKTLAYLLPVLAATHGGAAAGAEVAPGVVADPGAGSVPDLLLRRRRPHTALYLAPTKALAHDQLRVCGEFGLDCWNVATLDGDTERADRDWARDYASYVLTNPDMLHRSVLPQHARWASFLQSLRYVVIDESHRYRGVFGAHVSAVLRRLRRVAALYGASPTFVLASATSTNAAAAAGALSPRWSWSTATPRPTERWRCCSGSRTAPRTTTPHGCWPTWWTGVGRPSPSSPPAEPRSAWRCRPTPC
jgi:DEAD/DEAH box helicase domain-containing protein